MQWGANCHSIPVRSAEGMPHAGCSEILSVLNIAHPSGSGLQPLPLARQG